MHVSTFVKVKTETWKRTMNIERKGWVLKLRHFAVWLSLLLFVITAKLAAQDQEQRADNSQQRFTIPAFFQESVYQFRTGLDVLPGADTRSFRYWLVNGLQPNPRFFAGLGIGVTYYNDPLSLMPLFIDLNYAFKSDGIYPYLFLRSGYNFSIYTDRDLPLVSHAGGLFLNPGAGLQYETGSGVSWQLSLGYNSDRAHFKRQGFNTQIIETDITYRRLMLGVAILF